MQERRVVDVAHFNTAIARYDIEITGPENGLGLLDIDNGEKNRVFAEAGGL